MDKVDTKRVMTHQGDLTPDLSPSDKKDEQDYCHKHGIDIDI